MVLQNLKGVQQGCKIQGVIFGRLSALYRGEVCRVLHGHNKYWCQEFTTINVYHQESDIKDGAVNIQSKFTRHLGTHCTPIAIIGMVLEYETALKLTLLITRRDVIHMTISLYPDRNNNLDKSFHDFDGFPSLLLCKSSKYTVVHGVENPKQAHACQHLNSFHLQDFIAKHTQSLGLQNCAFTVTQEREVGSLLSVVVCVCGSKDNYLNTVAHQRKCHGD